MFFLHPWLLLGLAVLAVPVLLHLFNRKRSRRVEWGAMLFLSASLALRRRRVMLEEILLMVTRCLIVTLAALAFARPFAKAGSSVLWIVIAVAALVAVIGFAVLLTAGNAVKGEGRKKLAIGVAALALFAAVTVSVEGFAAWRRANRAGARDVVLLLDASGSMTLSADGMTNFDRARKAAEEFILSSPRNTAFSIVLGGAVPEALVPAPTTDRKQLLRLLDGAAPSQGTFNAPDGFAVAATSLAEGNNGNKLVVVFGDGQRQGWQPGANEVWACVEELFSRFPIKPRIVWETLPIPEGLRNLTLSDVRFSREVIGTDRPVRIDVTIVNNGAESATAAALALEVEGRSYVDKAIGQLAPGESRTVAFRHRFAKTGTHAVVARLDVSDDLPADDSATRVVVVRGPMEVLVVEGARGRRLADRPGAFIALALAPAEQTLKGPGEGKKADPKAPPPPRFLVKPTLKTVADLGDVESFSAYSAIVLADVPRIPSNTASRLLDYVERGGGLMVVHATRSRPDFYNGWKDADGAPFLPLVLRGEAVTGEGLPADPKTLSHPALEDLVEHGDLSTAVFENYWRTEISPAADARIGGSLFDGTPLLADRPVRKGHVLQFAAALDPASGNLISRQSFLPMVHELVYFLARPISPGLNLPPSSGASIALSDGASGAAMGEGTHGLRGVYYKGTAQDEVLAIRLDKSFPISWQQDKALADLRQDELFNVVWSGSVRVPRSGRYRFFTYDGGKASIAFADDKARAGLLRAGVTVDLDASRRHDFQISYLGKRNTRLDLRWSCPGVVPDQTIPAEFLSPVRVTGKDWVETYPARLYRPGEAAPLAATLRYTSDDLSLHMAHRLPPGLYSADVPAVFAPQLAGLAALSNGYGRISFCVKTDGEESRLATVLPDDKTFFSRFIDLVLVANEEELHRAVEGASVGRELWRYAAVPLLVLLLLEILLTRWITEHRRTGEEGHVSFDESAKPGSRFESILAQMAASGAMRTRSPSPSREAPSMKSFLLLPLVLADLPAPRGDLLPEAVPLFALVVMALAALALLVVAVRVAVRLGAPAPAGTATSPRLRKAAHLLLPVFPAVALAWTLLQILGRFAMFGVALPLWAMAIVFGLGCVVIALAYRRERRVVSRGTGRALVALRCLSYCIVAFMLLQPVFVATLVRHVERTVAVVFDVSGSMRFRDTEWTDGERLSFARHAGWVDDDDIPLPSLEAMRSLTEKLRPWTASDLANGRMPSALRRLVSKTRKTARRLRDDLGAHEIATSTNALFQTFSRQLADSVIPAVETLHDSPRDVSPADLKRLGDALGKLEPLFDPVRSAADTLAWEALPKERRDEVVARTDTNRLALATALLFDEGRDGVFHDELASRYGVRFYALGRSVKPVASEVFLAQTNRPAKAAAPWRTAPETAFADSDETASDFAGALETLLAEIPSEELAGVLMLTDGIHNGDASVEPIARRYGARGVPVGTVLVGSSKAPFDLAIADISAPESIFLGDKVRVHATLSATQARGKTAHVSLLKDGEKVDETRIAISDDPFRRDISLSDAPGTNGLVRYELRIDDLEGERFATNNSWKVDVAVSDDRTNVLLVDGFPRWEFRYLRNLFYARDKSVHLQYYLVHPDLIEGIDVTNRLPPASASRPFGEAEAGAMPVSPEEWRKFDVIILGDIGPDVLTPAMQTNLAECVTERGSLLVTIAGPRAMPHLYPTNSPLAALMPVTWSPKAVPDPWRPPESRFALELTQTGRVHPIMQQSSSPSENEQLWASFPRFTWRYPFESVKSAAEIIACAAPEGTDDPASAQAMTARNAAEQMERQRRQRERLAYLVAHNVGRGKVLALAGDETWRLRYRVGDTRHHRFWGQVIRWGLGERLRSGTRQLRVGTDRMTYSPHDPVRLLARVFTKDYDPVENAKLSASIAPAGPDGSPTNGPVLRVRLSHVPGSQGLYEAIVPPRPEAGVYSVSIENPERYSGEPAERKVETVFFVAASRRPIENAVVAATRETVDGLARWTGGTVLPPHRIEELAEAFGEPSRTLNEPLEIPLWDDWRLFALLAASLAAEWILRKKRGLL